MAETPYPVNDSTSIFRSHRTGIRHEADAERDHLALLLAQIPEAILCFDRNWVITYANAEAARVSRIQPSDIHTRTHWDLFPETVGTDLERAYRGVMEERTPRQIEYFYPPFGVWVKIHILPSQEGIALYYRDITARRQYEIVLQQQQDLLASIQQTALVATWDVDFDTGSITFGPGSYPVFGHPLASIPHFGAFKKILVPEYLPIIAKCLQDALQTGQVIVQEFQVKAANGETLWLESRGQAVFLDGKPSRVRGMTIDIGLRKKNEEALVASEARYRVLADLNPQAIWMGASDGSLQYANPNLLDYIGLTYEEVAQRGLIGCFHPEDHAALIEAWTRAAPTGGEISLEARMIRGSDGQSRWWWLRARAIRDETGKVLNWLGVAIDIDDSKTFAQQLLERQQETERQRAEIETVYQTAPVGLALFDPVEFRYLRLNDRLAEIIGLPAEKLLHRPITEIAPDGAREIFEQVLATRTMQRRLLEGEFQGRPGEKHFFNVNYSPVFAPDGSIQAIATATLDITHQKKAEAALIQSEKLAAVGRLASSISHEINNPLEAITNLLYLINHSPELPASLKPYLHTAQDELARVCQIATQTLRFHRQAVNATRVSAADLVNSVLTLYQGRLANSNIRVDASYRSRATIVCFENDIRQVLNNLIANAIDAMRQTGGRLIVRSHDATFRIPSSPRERNGIRITIADTGHGMSPTVRAHLFEPFYTTKDLNGTGLGLWISSGIVSRHQGHLSFRSTQHPIHHGTIFSLFLPEHEDSLPKQEDSPIQP